MPVWYLPDQCVFPHPLSASREGLLAVGGDLSLERLKLAYAYGIFPWYTSGEPILWWFPDPRCVIYPADIHVSRSMQAMLRQAPFIITFDTAFKQVINLCQRIPRKGQAGTWIQPEMKEAYTGFHNNGYAHSIEVWQDHKLVGGVYGVAMGRMFFGESMFSLVNNASKYALIILARFLQEKGFWMIDCQQDTPHIRRMGGILIHAEQFHKILVKNRMIETMTGKWTDQQTPLLLS